MKLLSPRERKFLENRLRSLYGVEACFNDLVSVSYTHLTLPTTERV